MNFWPFCAERQDGVAPDSRERARRGGWEAHRDEDRRQQERQGTLTSGKIQSSFYNEPQCSFESFIHESGQTENSGRNIVVLNFPSRECFSQCGWLPWNWVCDTKMLFSQNGQTAVHVASINGHEDVLKQLLLFGVEVDDRDNVSPILFPRGILHS